MPPPQPRTGPATHDVVWLARDDHESTGAAAPGEIDVFDWSDARHRGHLLTDRILSRLRISAPILSQVVNPAIHLSCDWVSRHVLEYGNRKLDTGKVLVTDRLHPHVLAALRSQPCVLLPDRYGKNRAVYEYSSRNYSTVHWADTPRQALELARELAADRSVEKAAAARPGTGPLVAVSAWLGAPLAPEQVELMHTIAAVAGSLALAA